MKKIIKTCVLLALALALVIGLSVNFGAKHIAQEIGPGPLRVPITNL